MLMLLMMCTYFLWVRVGTFEREWVWLQIAAEMKHAIADSEPEFVVACVGGNAARLPRRQPGSGGCCVSDPTMWVRGPAASGPRSVSTGSKRLSSCAFIKRWCPAMRPVDDGSLARIGRRCDPGDQADDDGPEFVGP
jgi:hypothetical protein